MVVFGGCMSYPNPTLAPASSELIALCQSQVNLLTQGLGASWTAIYLTAELVEETPKLVPIVVYPEKATFWQEASGVRLLNEANYQFNSPPRLQGAEMPQEVGVTAAEAEILLMRERQIVLPLIYEEVMMGILVTGRQDRAWNSKEVNQIEKIAKTVAIACKFERRQEWYKQQLREQEIFAEQQFDKFHDLLHQLQNPIAALRTFGKLLIKRLVGSPGDRQIVENIVRESDRLQDLLAQFRSWLEVAENATPTLAAKPTPKLLPGSSAETKVGFQLETLEITTILEPLLASAEAIAQEKGLRLVTEIPATIQPIKANPQALREVLSNLIDNAIKYTPQGQIYLQVGIEKQTAKQTYQGIAISDTGTGIPPADRERIFERHYRGVQAESEIPGSGLGLAIAREYIQQMQGHIELISPAVFSKANSSELPGTTFIVWLPVAN